MHSSFNVVIKRIAVNDKRMVVCLDVIWSVEKILLDRHSRIKSARLELRAFDSIREILEIIIFRVVARLPRHFRR